MCLFVFIIILDKIEIRTSHFLDIASKLFSVVGGGVRSAASLIVYLGEAAISLGQSIWAALPFGSGGGRTVGRSGSPRPRQEDHDAPNEPKARPPTDPSDTAAYRRQVRSACL